MSLSHRWCDRSGVVTPVSPSWAPPSPWRPGRITFAADVLTAGRLGGRLAPDPATNLSGCRTAVLLALATEDGHADYDRSTIPCIRGRLAEPAVLEPGRRTLSVTPDHARTLRAGRRSTPMTMRSETMTSEAIQSVLLMKPFRPFAIHVRSGSVYRVTDPDLVRVSTTTLTLLEAVPGTTTSPLADIDIAAVTALTLDVPGTETP